jgi:DNA processing protein
MNYRTINPGHNEWPDGLDQLAPIDAPEKLFVQGKSLMPRKKCLAVVGTRRCTTTGHELAYEFGRAFAEANFVVVSGLALGIDAAAHKGALEAGGHTVAVLGCGLDITFPERNAALQRQIAARGTLVTEKSLGTPPLAHHFPQRNRIIAGLSDAVLIVEGGFKSGALITARLALDANRHVLAVPGSPRNPVAIGPNHLIRAGEAAMAAKPKDVFDFLEEEVAWEQPYEPNTVPDLPGEELTVLHALCTDPASVDQICRTISRPAGSVALSLARLELRGFARRSRTGRYEITDAGVRVSLASA